jgi:HK97 family phage prohead protease
MKTLDFPMQVKAMSEAGRFEGYASIFGNIDEGQDVVEKGAFQEFVKTRDGKTLVLYQHSMRDPIGKATVTEDSVGLHVDGQLVMGDATAQKAYEHMKAGTIDGMSIGFDILPGGAEYTNGGVRLLKALKLYEVSVVTFGMNPLARVESVKAARLSTIREFEDFLRDAGGFTNAQAKLLASGGWKSLQSARDEPQADDMVQQLTERFAAQPVKI